MNVRLYKQFVKRINSTKTPTGDYVSKDVKLKDNTSFLNPTFELTSFDPSYNYVYVPSWGRYYFVSDFTIRNANIYEVSCSLDALASYKPSIGAYTCFVERTTDLRYQDIKLFDKGISSTENIVDVQRAHTKLFNSGSTVVCRVINSDTGITTYLGGLQDFKELFNPELDDISIIETISGLVKIFYM